MDALDAMINRASVSGLIEPAPDAATLRRMLSAAANAPDHGRLRPWRFLIVRGEGRRRLGRLLAEALRRREPEAPEKLLEKEAGKPLRAPMIVVVVAALQESVKIPRSEQVAATAAAAENLLLAAHALGFGCMWRTGAPAYDPHVKEGLGLGAQDEIVGFIYLGTAERPLPRRAAVDPSPFLRDWP